MTILNKKCKQCGIMMCDVYHSKIICDDCRELNKDNCLKEYRKTQARKDANNRYYAKKREEHPLTCLDCGGPRTGWKVPSSKRCKPCQVKHIRKIKLESEKRRRAIKANSPRVEKITDNEWLKVVAEFNHSCAYCNKSDVKLTQDHVIPLSKGGEHTIDNLVPACQSCNSKKFNHPALYIIWHSTPVIE